jgi:hypothetical protein
MRGEEIIDSCLIVRSTLELQDSNKRTAAPNQRTDQTVDER